MVVKNKKILIACFIILVIATILPFMKEQKYQSTVINGIENLNLESSDNNYLLFYPADIRVSQGNTIVKEVNEQGEVIQQYEIEDENFRRAAIHQKPSDKNELFISFFGEARIDNFFYKYNIPNRKFTKVDLDYFQHTVGIDHIMHYGQDVLFATILSHKTGDQNLNMDTDSYNISISNFSSKKSFETEYNYVPTWSALLGFKGKVIYGATGILNDEGTYDSGHIGFINLENQEVYYESPIKGAYEYFPLYTNDDYAYVISEVGKLIVYDQDFQREIYEPFKDIPVLDYYYDHNAEPLLLDENKALYSLYSEDNGSIIGIFTFTPEPTFVPLEKDYIDSDSTYRFLYQDVSIGEIYIIQTKGEKYNLLVIDSETLDKKLSIPVDYGYLLDFVVKN